MKVLVTGSEGRIGREVCKRLNNCVHFDALLGHNTLDWDMLRSVMTGCDAVVHLAAHPHPKADLGFDDYFENNVVGTYYVAACAAELGLQKMIYASSTSYYGFEEGIRVLMPAFEEQAPAASYVRDVTAGKPELSYSLTKVMAEQVVAFYGLSKQIKATILRFGPLGHWTLAETAGEAVVKALSFEHWYDVFNVVEDIAEVDGGRFMAKSGI